MPRSGGVYSLPSNYQAVSGETATATQHNSPLEDLETDMNTARPIVAGGTGATSAADARSNLGVDAAVAYQTKSANYTLVAADKGKVTRFSAAATANLTAAATLGSGWYGWIDADGGDVTIDPNSSELINGAATLTVPDGTTAFVYCTGTAFRGFAVVTLTGTQTLTNKTLTDPVIDQINDANGNEVLLLPATASAVNEATITNAATGGAPKISATGDDTNIGLELEPKGTGVVEINSPKITVGSDAQGDTFYRNSGGNVARLGIGTAGQVLTVNSGATAPEWADAANEVGLYTGSTRDETDFPVGHHVSTSGGSTVSRNQTATVRITSGGNEDIYNTGATGTALSGTWRARGSASGPQVLMQRTA